MYTGSNSFMPGPDARGNSSQFIPHGQAGGMAPPGLQPQMTGYPLQQQQHQFGAPGYPQQQQQQTSLPPQFTQQQPYPPQQQYLQTGQQMPSFQQQPSLGQYQNQTNQHNQQPTARPQLPQQTGMTSSQVADSFRSSPASNNAVPVPSNTRKIPSIRLSFITAQDQAKFEELFKSAVGSEQSLSGDKARELLLRSKLPGDVLSNIWYGTVSMILNEEMFVNKIQGSSQIPQSQENSCFRNLRLLCTCAI